MKTQVQQITFVPNLDVLSAEGILMNSETPVLGTSLKKKHEIMKAYTRLSLMNINELEALGSEFNTKQPINKFYIFVALFHNSFNACSKKIDQSFEERMEAFAKVLSITKSDCTLVTEFFQNTQVYSDKRVAVYFN